VPMAESRVAMPPNKVTAALLASLSFVIIATLEPSTTVIGAVLLVGVAVGSIAFLLHVWWRVPQLAAARRRAVLAGQAPRAAFGPAVPTGIAVDWGFPARAATLVVFDDDTVVLDFYPRAGIAGSTADHRVQEIVSAGQDLRMELRRLEHLSSRVSDFPLPRPGEVAFYIMEASGTRAIGPRVLQEAAAANDPCHFAEQSATRLLTLVCGTVPIVVPEPVLSLITQERS
jgi:hypothetical protein